MRNLGATNPRSIGEYWPSFKNKYEKNGYLYDFNLSNNKSFPSKNK